MACRPLLESRGPFLRRQCGLQRWQHRRFRDGKEKLLDGHTARLRLRSEASLKLRLQLKVTVTTSSLLTA